jgi:hypothetical protein
MIVEDEAFIFDGKAIERMFKSQQQKPTQPKEKESGKKATEKAKKKPEEQEV